MTTSMMNAWESDNFQFHARRRACLSDAVKVQNRVAVLIVDHGVEVDQLVEAVAGQPVEPHECADPAEALLLVGRMSPDVVILGPTAGRLDPIEFLTIIRTVDPQLPIVVGAGSGSGFLPLRFFAERLGALVTRPEVLAAVWGEGASVRSNTLSVHMMRLRKRLGDDDKNAHWIRSVRGLRYQFNVPPTPDAGPGEGDGAAPGGASRVAMMVSVGAAGVRSGVGTPGAEVAKRVDIHAVALDNGLTVDQLPDLDLSYTPPLGSPWDAVQLVAQAWLAAQ